MPDQHSQGLWNAYVELGIDREERNRRLAECPEDLRAAVKDHVKMAFSLRKKREEKSQDKQRIRRQEKLFSGQ